jgi:cytochrome c peroxidase
MKGKGISFVLLFICTSSLFLIVNRCSITSKSSIARIPTINHPKDNPTSAEKIALGKALFFDKRLSLDETIACASCHIPKLAFTDGIATSKGVFGRIVTRNSPTLLNVGYQKTLMFDGELKTLEMQSIVPIQEHNEMGMDMINLINKLKEIPEYETAAKKIFGRSFDPFVLTRSLGAFQRSLVAMNAPFDQYKAGNKKSMSAEAVRGWKLFSEKLYCASCHNAPHFTNFIVENNGLYIDYGIDKGRFRIHEDSVDNGMFKVPTLRNIALTAPYMHDGSFVDLDQVLDHYAAGGKGHVNQSKKIKPFILSAKERVELKSFFSSLTDTSYMIEYRGK